MLSLFLPASVICKHDKKSILIWILTVLHSIMVFMKFLEKIILKKKSADDKKACKFT